MNPHTLTHPSEPSTPARLIPTPSPVFQQQHQHTPRAPSLLGLPNPLRAKSLPEKSPTTPAFSVIIVLFQCSGTWAPAHHGLAKPALCSAPPTASPSGAPLSTPDEHPRLIPTSGLLHLLGGGRRSPPPHTPAPLGRLSSPLPLPTR